MNILSIVWDVDPTIFEVGPFEIRWYGLLFAMAFLVGFYMVAGFMKKDNVPESWADKLLIYMMLGTVLGARLGHVLFYDWPYYSEHPGEILKVWHGGLASHGGFIGIIIALWLFSHFVSKRSVWWVTDRIAVATALGGFFIRTGNLMNSEIFGHPTDVPWAFEFVRAHSYYPLVGRHPTQIYEALCYLLIFFLLYFLAKRKHAFEKKGLLTGLFFTLIFSARFFIEFLKENQKTFEDGMALNMGQLLSIPIVLAGLVVIYLSLRKKQPKKAPDMEQKISSNIKTVNK